MVKLPVCQAAPASRALSQIGLYSKCHTSDIPRSWTHTDYLGEGLAEQWPSTSLPQKTFVQLCSGRGSEIMANHNTQPLPGFPALWAFCPNTSKHGCFPGSAGIFAYGRLNELYQMHSKQGNCFFLCDSQTPQDTLPAAVVLPYFVTRAPLGTEF